MSSSKLLSCENPVFMPTPSLKYAVKAASTHCKKTKNYRSDCIPPARSKIPGFSVSNNLEDDAAASI